MRNLEIKIRLSAARLARLEETIREAGLPLARLTQVDSYVAVASGRLKLREITAEDGERAAELIAYQRPDASGPRWSTYDRLPLAPDDAARLKEMLAGTAGLVTVVSKRRGVAIRGRSRIHLDQVEGLGCFLEIETVAGADDESGIDQELRATLEWLGVDPAAEEPVASSYADLMRQHVSTG